MVGRISAKGRDLSGSYDLIENSIVNPLKRIDGVGQVVIDGIEPEEVSIYLEIDRLKAHRVDVGLLFDRIESMNVTTSLGEVTSAGLRYNVRAIGSFTEFEQVENLVIDESGLRLKDIADRLLRRAAHHVRPAPGRRAVYRVLDPEGVRRELGRGRQEGAEAAREDEQDPRLEGRQRPPLLEPVRADPQQPRRPPRFRASSGRFSPSRSSTSSSAGSRPR